ncbi:MAG: D-arabinono-1,4-lactone oxidase [Streptosporangiaceae bacterium]
MSPSGRYGRGSRTATATPARWCLPHSAGEIAAAVKEAAAAGLTVRAVGSGHSFTPVAATDGVALDLSLWTGIVAADTPAGLVAVRSGTTLRALNAALDGLGLAMANLGDIDAQTLAGALCTGTHGTGARLGGLATQVEALELVLADGSLVSCSGPVRPELFAAARIGLGALGVISTVTLRCVPSFTLAAEYTEASHRVFVTPRRVRFTESEYAVPRESLVAVLGELRRAVPRLADPVMFPVEVRVAAADDIWLSTAYQRETAYIAIHQHSWLPYRAYFDAFSSIVADVDGRPHWGKLHGLGAERLGRLYPRHQDFRRVRAEVDPEGRFGNPYLTQVLGRP